MKQTALIPLLAAMMLAAGPVVAQDAQKAVPSPGEIVAAAPASDWKDIAPEDLLVMTLAPDARGKPRKVVMQLVPAPFSLGWVTNIRTLAKAHWYDGNAIYRVQDNYVTQWGDPNDGDKARKVPDGLKTMNESDYSALVATRTLGGAIARPANRSVGADAYAARTFFLNGWPLAANAVRTTATKNAKTGKLAPPPAQQRAWPLHCYGAVGVARGQRPNAGDGTALYAVNGHAARHLDRNIAVAGRIVEGMEYLSGLPRGTEALGFYKEEADYVPILSVRLASELPAAEQPHLQYLSTESASFAKYADARANRRDPFFLVPAGGADICNIPVPTRRKP